LSYLQSSQVLDMQLDWVYHHEKSVITTFLFVTLKFEWFV
jgi:hypothetical protein